MGDKMFSVTPSAVSATAVKNMDVRMFTFVNLCGKGQHMARPACSEILKKPSQ